MGSLPPTGPLMGFSALYWPTDGALCHLLATDGFCELFWPLMGICALYWPIDGVLCPLLAINMGL